MGSAEGLGLSVRVLRGFVEALCSFTLFYTLDPQTPKPLRRVKGTATPAKTPSKVLVILLKITVFGRIQVSWDCGEPFFRSLRP